MMWSVFVFLSVSSSYSHRSFDQLTVSCFVFWVSGGGVLRLTFRTCSGVVVIVVGGNAHVLPLRWRGIDRLLSFSSAVSDVWW